MKLIKKLEWNKNWKVRESTKFGVIHNAAAINFSFEQCNKYHTEELKYHNIAYHIYIQKNREKFEGRPLDIEGAHCYGYNENSIGICLEGNYDIEKLSSTMKIDLIDSMKYIQSIYPNIIWIPHRELVKTDCPGAGVITEWSDILSKIQVETVAKKNYVTKEEFETLHNQVARITEKLHRLENKAKR